MALFWFGKKAEVRLKEMMAEATSQATNQTKEIEKLCEQLKFSSGEVEQLANQNGHLAGALCEANRKCDAAEQQIKRLYEVPGLVEPTSPNEQWLSRRAACNLYGDGTEDRCLETLTSYSVARTFDGQKVRLVVPKFARRNPTKKDDLINLAEFHEYPELFEGLNLYAMEQYEIKVSFLFASCWEENEVLHIRPACPNEADSIIANIIHGEIPGGAAKRKEAEEVVDELMEGCKAEIVGKEGMFYRLELDYLGVEFNSKIDAGYTKEDFYHIHGAWLKNLRAQCQKRWENYFEPQPDTATKETSAEE